MDADIYNRRRLDDRVTTSGRMTPADLDTLAALGVGCVVSLAPYGVRSAMHDEAAEVQRHGTGYVQIPVDFATPTDADFAGSCAVLAERAADALRVHCIANWRVSAFFWRYRRDVLGWDDAAARAPMDAIWDPDGAWTAFLTPPRPAPPRVPAT